MTRNTFVDLFGRRPALIGMVHVQALPGTPAYRNNDTEILELALREAAILQRSGVDGLLIENMHDLPYLNRSVGPEITAMMTRIGYEVKRSVELPVGVQVLAGANRPALAVAKAAGLDFVRAEGFVFAHVADEGLMQSDAGELLRYRRQIDAGHIPVFTDIKKKHGAHALTADVDIVETARAAAFFRSDGLVVTGTATGKPTDPEELARVQAAVDLPVLVGSGVTPDNLEALLPHADGLIVGSWLKREGHWANEVEEERVRRLVGLVRGSGGC